MDALTRHAWSWTRWTTCAVAIGLVMSARSAASTAVGVSSAVVGATLTADSLPMKGLRSAPLTLVAISDFRCSYCARFVRDTLGRLDGAYIKTGKVRYVFWDFPLRSHPESFGIHLFAGCAAEQNGFWQVHDVAFSGEFPSDSHERLALAARLGLHPKRLGACLNSPVQRRRLGARIKLIRDLGIAATPTILLGTTTEQGMAMSVKTVMRGAHEYDELRAVIERTLLLELYERAQQATEDSDT